MNFSYQVTTQMLVVRAAHISLIFIGFFWSGFAAAQAMPEAKQTFPKIGGYNIGAKNYDDPTYQAGLAKLDWVIFDFYRGWNRNGQSIADVVSRLKAKNPSLLVSQYVTISSSYEHRLSQPEGDLTEKLNSEIGPARRGDWWAYTAGGQKLGWQAEGRLKVNYTTFVEPDENGDYWPQYRAKRDKAVFFDEADFDVIYIDNFREKDWTESGRPDYDRDGRSDDSASRDARYREAQLSYVKALRTLMPGKYVVGNVTEWVVDTESPIIPEYRKVLNGALLEHVMGASWSVEGTDANGNKNGWGSWQKMMATYRKAMAATTDGLVLFNVRGYTDNYKFMRYGLTSCLMDDGYFDYTDHTKIYSGVAWFDEYDVDLGRAVSPPQTSPWNNGVYRRDFEKGVVLVNPRGNGARTVTLEAGLRHFQGMQDPVRNNGRVAEKVTIADADGVILLRESAVTVNQPRPPVLIQE